MIIINPDQLMYYYEDSVVLILLFQNIFKFEISKLVLYTNTIDIFVSLFNTRRRHKKA